MRSNEEIAGCAACNMTDRNTEANRIHVSDLAIGPG